MGYRSRVYMCIESNFKKELIETLDSEKYDWFIEKLKSPDFENKDGIYVKFDYLKWYSSDIDELEEILFDKADTINFVRLGEDWDDIELFGDFIKIGELVIDRVVEFQEI